MSTPATLQVEPGPLLQLVEEVDVTDEDQIDALVELLLQKLERKVRKEEHPTLSGDSKLRLGVLSERVDRLQDDTRDLKSTDARHDVALTEIRESLIRIESRLEKVPDKSESPWKNKGLWTGIVAVATAIGSAIAGAINYWSGK